MEFIPYDPHFDMEYSYLASVFYFKSNEQSIPRAIYFCHKGGMVAYSHWHICITSCGWISIYKINLYSARLTPFEDKSSL